MTSSDYWGALTSRQRVGVIAGAVVIVLATVALATLLLHDPYVPLASGLDSERVSELARELDGAKIDYRVAESGDVVVVPRSQLGKAHAATAGGPFEVPPSVGLELFKESDFSSTDFAQRINYQRALQGELTRTIQSLEAVRSARVHVILPDGGLFKRETTRATAAVSVTLHPGKQLTPFQVRGIQRLVAAAVPEIKIDDVVVLDDAGATLTRAAGEGEASSGQWELKREADQYLEGKLARLLQDLVPQGSVSLSVDAVLEDRQSRVTREEPIAGVVVKERQSQHRSTPGADAADGDAADGGSTEWEHEYVVGHRTEQTQAAAGSIKRVSVSVALQGASPELTRDAVEQLIANAVGIDKARGDSVTVLLLPAAHANAAPSHSPNPATSVEMPAAGKSKEGGVSGRQALTVIAIAALLFALATVVLARRRARAAVGGASDVAPDVNVDIDVEETAARVRQWLNEGRSNARG